MKSEPDEVRPTHRRCATAPRILCYVLLLALLSSFARGAQSVVFSISGVSVALDDFSPQIDVYFQSMRLNRAQNVWNAELILSNRTTETISGPFVLQITSALNTSGAVNPDGVQDGKAFFELSSYVANSTLGPHEVSQPRTIAFGFARSSPNIGSARFARASRAALGFARTLDAAGLPLPGVSVFEIGPGATRTLRSDDQFGLVTLGTESGPNTWRFELDGFLPVWRQAILPPTGVLLVPSPRLTRRADSGGTGQVSIPPGSGATVTPLTAQTLPFPLPIGWSPLQAFWIEGASQSLKIAAVPWDTLSESDIAAWVQLDTNQLAWRVLQNATGTAPNPVNVTIPANGAYALVVADGGATAPPNPVPGATLPSSAASIPPGTTFSAAGSVNPLIAAASATPEFVTGTATVIFSNNVPVPSGAVFRTAASESYTLRDGTRRVTPQTETFIAAYQRPGDQSAQTLHASFPIRPLLLVGPEQLDQAVVRVDVLGDTVFGGSVIDASGGELSADGLRLLAPQGIFAQPEAVYFRSIPATNINTLDSLSNTVVAAFELGAPQAASGKSFVFRGPPQIPNSAFVLARVASKQGIYGCEPVERFNSDSGGTLGSAEPLSGDRLPGVNGAGVYLLVQMPQAQGMILGTTRDASGKAQPSLLVRADPWLTFSSADGSYKLLAPTGVVSLAVADLVTGNQGVQSAIVKSALTATSVDLSTAVSGPRVMAVSPQDGASNVSRVTPVEITFSKPVNPGTIVGNGVRLLDTNGVAVAASVSIDLQNITVSLLPTTQLNPATRYTISLASSISDLQGHPLEGPGTFTFTTATDALNRVAGQFIIYEPLDGLAPVSGSAGTADPESAVILVNEATGQTSTILSGPDGSFTNSISASVDDFISAVLVNQNGTRTTLPASRQVFRDGSVALFGGGGILEAQSDGGPIQVIVDPGAIPNKTKFKLDPLKFADLLLLVQNTPPAGGKLLGGIQFKVEGDPLRSPAKLRFPVDPGSLDLPPGVAPENASYAVATPKQVNGVLVYSFVDKMRFRDGFLQTNPGLLESDNFAIFKAGNGNQVPVDGKVSSALFLSTGGPDESSLKPVPGAVVLINSAGLSLVSPSGQIAAGAMVSIADATGHFSTLAQAASLDPAGNAFSLLGISPFFPGQLGSGSASALPNQDLASASGRVLFNRGGNSSPNGQDFLPPSLSLTRSPLNPAAGGTTQLSVLANDDRNIASVNVTIGPITSLDAQHPASSADVVLNGPLQGSQTAQSLQQSYSVTGNKALRVELIVTAVDGSGNQKTLNYPIEFGGTGPILVNPNVDPNDHQGPSVVTSSPANGTEAFRPGNPISLTFSEPIDPGFQQNLNLAFQLQPAAGTPNVTLSEDRRTVQLNYFALQPGTDYTLDVTPIIQDSSGNGLDQNPDNDVTFESFVLSFRTADFTNAPLPGISSGGGIAGIGKNLFALDRSATVDGALVVINIANPGKPALVTQLHLLPFPRDIVAIPAYEYRRTLTGPPETNDLVVVVGGAVAGEGQWITVINVSDPANPQRLASTTATPSPSAALTKLAWSPPLLGFLQSDGDITSVSLVNLQLFIYGQNLADGELQNEPAAGDPGLDRNGDGDYADPGDRLPRLVGASPRLGLINGGLVASYTLRDQTTQRILDFDLGFGGAFVGVITGPGAKVTSGGTGAVLAPQYITLASGSTPQDITKTAIDLPIAPKRLLTLFGVALDSGTNSRLANLALVTLPPAQNGSPGEVEVIDISNPLAPVKLSDIPIPPERGIPQSILRRADGLLMLATSSDLILLDPARLGLAVSGGLPHPALVGLISGAGSGARAFVGSAADLYAVNLGGLNQLSFVPGSVNLVAHQPGRLTSPGAVVPELAEENPASLLVPVNEDDDDGVLPSNDNPNNRLPQSYNDDADNVAGPNDNDLVQLTFSRVPPDTQGNLDGKIEVRVQCSSGVDAVRLFNAQGEELSPEFTSPPGQRLYSTDLKLGTGALTDLRTKDVNLYLEALAPDPNVTVRFTYKSQAGDTIGQDEVHLIAFRVRIAQVWSDQFPDRDVNRLPDSRGDNSYPMLLMATRSDGKIYAKARFEVQPDLSSVKSQLQFRLANIQRLNDGTETLLTEGSSSVAQPGGHDVAAVVRNNYSGPDYFVVAGLDRNLDGELSTGEISTVYGGAYLAGEQIIYSKQSDPKKARFWKIAKELHLKVIDSVAYRANQAEYGAIADLAGLDGSAWSPRVLHAFVFGDVPVTLSSITQMPIPPPVITTEVLHPNQASYAHNVGVTWDANGTASIPHYIFDGTTILPDKIASSEVFRAWLKGKLQGKFADIKAAFVAAPGQTTQSFTWHIVNSISFHEFVNICANFPDSIFASPQDFLSAILGCADFDLFVGIGGATMDVTITATVKSDTNPWTPASQLSFDGPFGVTGFLYDLYDWNFPEQLPDHDLASIEAGFGTLGNGGRVFSYKILLNHNITLSVPIQ